MFPFVAADIGGTNARYGLVTGKQNGAFVIGHEQIYACREFEHFEDSLQAYIDSLGDTKVNGACIAIAGPVTGDWIKFTNLNWAFSADAVRKRFGFEAFYVLNDFGAQALATTQLSSSELAQVRAGEAMVGAPRTVMGPGTGLGIAILNWVGDSWQVLPGEGGHVSFAPVSAVEQDILKVMQKHHGVVSLEMVMSGPGLRNIYRSLCEIAGQACEELAPGDITARALSGEDAVCVQALDVFADILAGAAGNMALVAGARGGVYIGGGIAKRMIDKLSAPAFAERFANKGVIRHFLEPIPVYVITKDCQALAGAAVWYERQQMK